MKQELNLRKEIKDSIWNIGEDDIAQIINVYYRYCINDDMECVDDKDNRIYNLLDKKQACAAIKAYGLPDVAQAFIDKPDWILIVGYDEEAKKHIFKTEAPSEALNRILNSVIYAYCLDPMAYPAIFREAVAQPIANIVNLNL